MQLEQHCRETAELFGAINELWHAAEPGDHHQRRCLVMTAHCTQMLVVWMVEQADLVDELAGCPLQTPAVRMSTGMSTSGFSG